MKICFTIALLAAVGAMSSTAATVDFNRDVRPILSDRCYTCHGPDEANRKSKVRFDIEASARPALAEMIRRVSSDNKALRMPPVFAGPALSAGEIDVLRRWVAEGAEWQKHWSLIAPKRPALPAVKQSGWVRNAIDTFVLARLEREGLAPSPEADKAALLRRVSLDLTGVPPTLAELDSFLGDASPDAYNMAVDRLLASPRYGERMAYRWLDAARYADTNGYQTDAERFMWRWRDWVIEAFNRNLSFDRFTIEQLAGDLLPTPTLDQIIATGFNRNHRGNGEGGIVPEEYAVEYVVDRVETTSTVWLGLTTGCARCHDHKYDPISQRASSRPSCNCSMRSLRRPKNDIRHWRLKRPRRGRNGSARPPLSGPSARISRCITQTTRNSTGSVSTTLATRRISASTTSSRWQPASIRQPHRARS